MQVPLLITLASAANVAAHSPRVDERIARVETGLLRPILLKGESRVTMSLQDRMARYKAPGISIAVLDGGALAWARLRAKVWTQRRESRRRWNCCRARSPALRRWLA